MTDYDKQTQDFLKRFKMDIFIQEMKIQTRPPWWEKETDEYGKEYVVFLRKCGCEIDFPFWGSIHDKIHGNVPSPAEVLACISGDCHCPETFDDFCSEYGYDTDSRQAYATWERCLAFSEKLNHFFTPEEIEALQEIQ